MGRLPPPVAYAASAALHLAALAGLARLPPLPSPDDDVSVEVIDVVPLPAAPPAPTPEPEVTKREPEPPPPRPATRRPAAPRDAPRVATVDPAPPPPSAEPPEDAPRRAPVRVGVAMSATTEGGSFSAPSGNTLQGELPRTAPDPRDVQPYRSERYVPPAQVTVLPRPVSCDIPQAEYPEAARRAGVEGRVVLTLVVDEAGRVAEAKVVEEPGHGLGEAAVAGVKRHCRFEPARKGEERVATRLRYTVRYELP
jgi:periplasmic protein TonB